MSAPSARKLSREEIAACEIGHTEIGPAQKRTLTAIFLAIIVVYPVCQCCCRAPWAEWRDAGDLKSSIKNYETAIEDTSLLIPYYLESIIILSCKIKRMNNE